MNETCARSDDLSGARHGHGADAVLRVSRAASTLPRRSACGRAAAGPAARGACCEVVVVEARTNGTGPEPERTPRRVGTSNRKQAGARRPESNLPMRQPTGIRLVAACVLALAPLAPAHTARAEPVPMTAREYQLYRDYLGALDDERVKKMPEGKRLAAIARNFKVPEKDLASAVGKGDKVGRDAARRSETEIRSLVDGSGLAGRVHDLRVDDSAGHVVTYVGWKNVDPAKLEQEASLAALLAARGAPISHTIAVWAVDAAGRKVFEGKISAEAAGRFNAERMEMFASTRYIRIFEDVRNAYKGTPPADAPRSN